MFFPAYHAYSFSLKVSDSIFVLIVSDFIIHSSHIVLPSPSMYKTAPGRQDIHFSADA